MFHVPQLYPEISLKLASVLEEIGVNERIILKRRRAWLLDETLHNISGRLMGYNFTHLYFGSQLEGSTTLGLDSDTDNLLCYHDMNVIQDKGEWEPGHSNLLMIQEETTPPGYCMLQHLDSNDPTAVTEVLGEHHVRYRGDKVLIKNTFFDDILFMLTNGQTKRGPAGTVQIEGFNDQDYVHAYQFKTLPQFLVSWLQHQTQQGNISQDMKRYIESNPCYVVPVGRKNSSFEEVEWRISTSHAEKCMMFSLNSTQLQCYFLLKLILKTFLKHPQEKALSSIMSKNILFLSKGKTHQENSLSSFMCKNILLLCIGKTHPTKWCPQNLLSVFRLCLLQLKRCILHGYCPHFIMSENNLMAGKFTPEVKKWLLEKVQMILETHWKAFLDVAIDDIGHGLQTRLRQRYVLHVVDQLTIRNISGGLIYNLAITVNVRYRFILQSTKSGKSSFNDIITSLVHLNHHGSDLEQAASRLLTPLICSSLGSVIASKDILQYHSVSPEALTWLSLGLSSDVAYGNLKMASVYYCVGDFKTTKTILSNIVEKYDERVVEAVCGCYEEGGGFLYSERFGDYANSHNEISLRHTVAFCVKFLPDEVHCQPRELQYEMFRSTQEDRAHRDECQDFWMDWAVVDSLPYLYFLQYKTYGHLQCYDEQRQALNNFVRSIRTTKNLRHKETALNLLGQCYQQENRHTEALQCYMDSLNVRQTNNAARLHICLLLYAIYSS